jgi:hypothetical protein
MDEQPRELPNDAKLDDLDWDTTLDFLKRICGQGLPVIVGVGDPRTPEPSWLVQIIGRLVERPSSDSGVVLYSVRSTADEQSGKFELRSDLFDHGYLETIDGAGYFTLRISLGTWSIIIGDTETGWAN